MRPNWFWSSSIKTAAGLHVHHAIIKLWPIHGEKKKTSRTTSRLTAARLARPSPRARNRVMSRGVCFFFPRACVFNTWICCRRRSAPVRARFRDAVLSQPSCHAGFGRLRCSTAALRGCATSAAVAAVGAYFHHSVCIKNALYRCRMPKGCCEVANFPCAHYDARRHDLKNFFFKSNRCAWWWARAMYCMHVLNAGQSI